MYQKRLYQQKIDAGDTDPKLKDKYHQRIIRESTAEQVLLLIPIIGQFSAGISFVIEKCQNKDPVYNPENFDHSVNYEGSYQLEKADSVEAHTARRAKGDEYWQPLLKDKLMPDWREPEFERLIQWATCANEDMDLTKERAGIAQFILAAYFASSDHSKARFWIRQAAQNGLREAVELLRKHPNYPEESSGLTLDDFDFFVNYSGEYPIRAEGPMGDALRMQEALRSIREMEQLLFDGRPLEQPDNVAHLLRLKDYATELGSPSAQFILGKYFAGLTDCYLLQKDMDKARFWLNQAVNNGSEEAVRFLDENPQFKS